MHQSSTENSLLPVNEFFPGAFHKRLSTVGLRRLLAQVVSGISPHLLNSYFPETAFDQHTQYNEHSGKEAL